MTTRIATQEAAHNEEVIQRWRDWLQFLRCQQTLLQVQTASTSSFEQEDAHVQEQRAQETLKAVPPPLRTLYDQHLDARRQQIQRDLDAARRAAGGRGAAVDPDAVTRHTLEALLGEAEGVTTADGRGMVPLDGEQWWALDVQDLLNAPGEASYAVTGTRGGNAAQRTGLGLLLGAGLLLAVMFWPRAEGATVVARYDVAANGEVIATWQPLRLALGTDTRAPLIDLAPAAPWPPADETLPAAYQQGATWPLVICLPAAQQAAVRQVRLLSAGATPDRLYLIADQRGPVADLVVTACDDAGRPPRYGVVQETPSLTAHAVGQGVELPGTTGVTVTVAHIAMHGHASDPTLPLDQARVTVRVTTNRAEELDWTAWQPRLTIPNGQALLPADTRPDQAGARLHYLIPLPQDAQEVLFSLTGATGQQVRWRTRLAPPPDRDALLRQALAVSAVAATPTGEPQAQTLPIELRLTLTNQAATPLALESADLSLTHDGTAVPLSVSEVLRDPLAPGEPRPVVLTAVVPTTDPPLVLTVGVVRYTLQVTVGET